MICLSIEAINFNECIEIIKTHDFVELRLDKCNFTNEEINKIFSYPIKFIATCRPGFHPDNRRKDILKRAASAGAEYIDIEIDSDEKYFKDLINFAKKNQIKTIASYHNINKTPANYILLDCISWCYHEMADIAKIACKVNTIEDCQRILSLYNGITEFIDNILETENRTSKNTFKKPFIPTQVGKAQGRLIAIGLGELGRITRIAAPSLGAPFTYASYKAGLETADGQIDIDTLKKIYELMK